MTNPQDPWQSPDPQWQQPQPAGPPPGQPPFGQAQPGQQPFGQAPFGQAQPGQQPFGQAPFGQAPQYPAYPGMAQMPMPSQRPPMPATVRNAVALMFAGMALSLIGIAVGLGMMSSVKDEVRRRLSDNGTLTDATYNSAVNVVIALIVIAGLIQAGLWLWMALICRMGRNWGRVLSSVFFGIGCLSLFGLANPDTSAFSKVMTVLTILIGLVTIILLWNGQSAPYFKPQQATFPYAYGQPQYGQQPTYGQPPQQPYGQQQPPYGQG